MFKSTVIGTINEEEAKEILYEAINYDSFTGEGEEEIRTAKEILAEFLTWAEVDAYARTIRWGMTH